MLRRIIRIACWPLWIYSIFVWVVLTLCAILLSVAGLRAELSESYSTVSFGQIFLLIGVTPIAETIAFQMFPTEILRHYRIRTSIRIIVSAVLFGSMHYYSPVYILVATILGFILATAFVLRCRFCGLLSAVVSVGIAHALNNALSLLFA